MSTAEERERKAAYQRRWRAKHSTGQPVGRPRTAECGTQSAYKRHQRLGEPIDAACREAWNAWQRDYYRTHRSTK